MGKAFHDELPVKFMIPAIVLFFFVIAYIIFLQFYAKWFLYRSRAASQLSPATTVYYLESSAIRGLDPTVLKSIPILSFYPGEHEKGMECAVCLTEIVEGERFRLLPKCQHGFHVDCIDMWFASHPNCPVCRDLVSKKPSGEVNLESSIILQTASRADDEDTTTVTGWATLSSPSTSSSSGMVAIDMPLDEEQGIVTKRLRSLKRMLSSDRRVNPCTTTSTTDHATQQ